MELLIKERRWSALLAIVPEGEEITLSFPDQKHIDTLSTMCYRHNVRNGNGRYKVLAPKELRSELKATITKLPI